MDYFTNFAEAYPLRSMDAETVAQTLVNEFIIRYDVPLQLHSDRGTNFMSDLFKMCQLLGFEKMQTTSFHPQSDGLVERFNKTLETMLSMYVDRKTGTNCYQLLHVLTVLLLRVAQSKAQM